MIEENHYSRFISESSSNISGNQIHFVLNEFNMENIKSCDSYCGWFNSNMPICLLFQWINDIYPELSGKPFKLYHTNSKKQINMTDLSVLSAIGEEQIMEFNIINDY